MLFEPKIRELKKQADDKWLRAMDLEANDYEGQEIEACFEAAFDLYQEIDSLLEKTTIEKALTASPTQSQNPDIIELYYVYKILATAYFDMGEYEKAASYFQDAYQLHQRYQNIFVDEVTAQELNAIQYNLALAEVLNFEEQQENGVTAHKVGQIADVFIKEIAQLHDNGKMGYHRSKTIDLLFRCKALYSGKKVEFTTDLEKQKIVWALSFVLTPEQINTFILAESSEYKSLDEFLKIIQSTLTNEQIKKIQAFSPPKSKVADKIENMISETQKFKQSDEYKKLKLYPYQEEAIAKFEDSLIKGKNKGYYTAATGTGKTRIFISQILATNSKTIILVPSIALANQTKDKLQEQLDELGIKKRVGVFADGEKSTGDIVIMTYNSLKAQLRRPPKKREIKIDQYPLVILDEAHLALTEKANEIVQELAQDKVVIGCTATEEYNTKRPRGSLKALKELFGEENCFFEYPIDKAIEEKSLSPIHICMVTTDTSLRWKRGAKKKKSRQNEISEKEAAEQINQDKINTVVAEIYANAVHPNTEERIFGKQAVSFCAGIDHAKAVAEKFNAVFKDNPYFKEKGLIPAAYISGELDGKQQKTILNDFNAGKILMLCGSDILVTGIDNPNISAAFNLRPTRSKVMALQRGGRTVRKSKDLPHKVALIFEFNWVVDGQVFLDEFLGSKHQLGEIPTLKEQNKKLQTLRREEVATHYENGARWELDWTGKVRAHSVGVLRKKNLEVKVPEQTYIPVTQTIAENEQAFGFNREPDFDVFQTGSLLDQLKDRTSLFEELGCTQGSSEGEYNVPPLTFSSVLARDQNQANEFEDLDWDLMVDMPDLGPEAFKNIEACFKNN